MTFLVRLLLALAALASLTGAAASAPGASLCVMTYNVRYANNQPREAWHLRRPLIRDLIRQTAPDVIGTQEGVYSQLKDMAADLPEYAWIGLGRDGGSRGEFMAVFYRTERLEPLAFDHFWLSDTPEVMGSKTWGPQFARMVTWIRFRDRQTGQEFSFWNTHFDHEVQPAREKSATLVRERVSQLDPGLPVILVGDFNAPAGANPAYDTLVGDGYFQDTWRLARERRNEGVGTFNGFGDAPPGDARIDWILARGAVDVAASAILTDHTGELYPSDHYPVVAWLTLPVRTAPAPAQ